MWNESSVGCLKGVCLTFFTRLVHQGSIFYSSEFQLGAPIPIMKYYASSIRLGTYKYFTLS